MKKLDGRRNNSRPKGSKNKNPYPRKGENSHMAKKWDLYRHSVFFGTFVSTTEIAEIIGCHPQRPWQMANGWNGGHKLPHPIISKDGWCVLRHGETFGWWLDDE